MKLKSLFSPKALIEAVRIVANRFPVSVGFLAVWTVWMLLFVTDAIEPSYNLNFAMLWASAVGFFLTVAVTIWTEYLDRLRLQKPLLLIASILAIADFVIIYITGTGSEAGEIGRTALMTGIWVSILFIPVSKGLDKNQLTAYTFRQFTGVASAVFLATIFAIAILIIFGTLEALFGDIDFRIAQVFFVLFCGTVQCIFYLRYIPRHQEIQLMHYDSLRIIAACARNIILPLCIIYMAILYAYGFKILAIWSLPKGTLTWAVTGLSTVSLIVLYCMQPYYAAGNKIAILARRLLPKLMLPLIVLMSIGLIYRFGEYGPTASRVYVALFAIWAFITFLWLSIRSEANMNLIAMTFAGAFITVSIIPGFNVSSLVNKYIHAQIVAALDSDKLPMNLSSLKAAIEKMPQKEAKLTASRISYLDCWDDHSMVSDIVTNDSKVTEWELYTDDEVEIVCTAEEYTVNDPIIDIPAGYNAMQDVDKYYGYSRPRIHDVLRFDSLEVHIPADSLYKNGLSTPLIRQVNDSTVFYLTKIRFINEASIRVIDADGIIFTKRSAK